MCKQLFRGGGGGHQAAQGGVAPHLGEGREGPVPVHGEKAPPLILCVCVMGVVPDGLWV